MAECDGKEACSGQYQIVKWTAIYSQIDILLLSAPVAQMDRANASEALGQGFESLRARHNPFSSMNV
jgi:hypothetical protein